MKIATWGQYLCHKLGRGTLGTMNMNDLTHLEYTTDDILNSWKSSEKSSAISFVEFLSEGRQPNWYSKVF